MSRAARRLAALLSAVALVATGVAAATVTGDGVANAGACCTEHK
jgi:hypothetical protein